MTDQEWAEKAAAGAANLKPGEALTFSDIDTYIGGAWKEYERDMGHKPLQPDDLFFRMLSAVVDVLRNAGRKYRPDGLVVIDVDPKSPEDVGDLLARHTQAPTDT